MSILKKIRSLSKKKKKIILWFTMLVVTVFLSSIYIQNVRKTLKENEEKELLDSSFFQEIQEQANEAKKIIFDSVKSENNIINN